MAARSIRPLSSAAEIDSILAVEAESFTNPWTREMYLAELAHRDTSRIYFMTHAENVVVGFCSCWLVVDELHINNLAVRPDYRRAGVATELLRYVFREGAAEGAVRATLEVRRSNDPARLLYERFGFAVAGIRRGYYTKPVEDALVLWKQGLNVADGST